MIKLIAVFGLFLLQTSFAFASGGDITKQNIECKGSGLLVQTRLSQDVDGNIKNNAHVLVYDSNRGKSQMLTSFEHCTSSPRSEFIDVKGYKDILMCGSILKKASEISPNQAGFYGLFFSQNKSVSFKLKCEGNGKDCSKGNDALFNQVIPCQ
jgi:hypothetical protein